MDLRDGNQTEEGHYICLDSVVKCGANSWRLESFQSSGEKVDVLAKSEVRKTLLGGRGVADKIT